MHIRCAQDDGKEYPKMQIHSPGNISAVEWAEHQEHCNSDSLRNSNDSVNKLIPDSLKLGDDFGSLNSKSYDVSTQSLSPFLESPTTSSSDDFSDYLSQSSVDLSDDGYDSADLINTFTEAVSDWSSSSSYYWISALEKCPLPSFVDKNSSFKFRKHRLMGKRIGLRQQYLLLKWDLARQRVCFNQLAKEQSGHIKPLAAVISDNFDHLVQNFENTEPCEDSSFHSTSVDQKHMQELSFNVTCLNSVVRRDRFDPLDVRAEVASISELFRLTKEKDINGLRALLNEYRWPKIELLRPVISELLKTFIELAADVKEVKQLIWDFAATDNRAYIADSVTLLFLERIVRESGIQSAEAYARHHRDLFLVRPPMERSKRELNSIYYQLFATALETADVNEAQNFVDLLIELGYLEDNSIFLELCLNKQLNRFGYQTAFLLWASNVKNRRNSTGIHLLIRNILTTMNLKEQAKQLDELFKVALETDHPYMALGELIVELLIADRDLEAEALLKKLTLSGHHISVPLMRLKGSIENLVHIERISDLVSKCLFAEKNARHRKKKSGEVVCEQVELIHNISSIFISKWSQKKRRKNLLPKHKAKRFTLNAAQLNELAFCIQDVWTDIADVGNDTSALERMFVWCIKNGLQVQSGVIKKCVRIFERNGIKCPLEQQS